MIHRWRTDHGGPRSGLGLVLVASSPRNDLDHQRVSLLPAVPQKRGAARGHLRRRRLKERRQLLRQRDGRRLDGVVVFLRQQRLRHPDFETEPKFQLHEDAFGARRKFRRRTLSGRKFAAVVQNGANQPTVRQHLVGVVSGVRCRFSQTGKFDQK